MIKTVIWWSNNAVMVCDEKGEQIPEYQGRYEDVKDKILKDSSPATEFSTGVWKKSLTVISREEFAKE